MSLRVTIVELKEAMCRWPLGDPATGGSAIADPPPRPLLRHHGGLAYQPVQDAAGIAIALAGLCCAKRTAGGHAAFRPGRVWNQWRPHE